MHHHRGQSGRKIYKKWHDFRANARKTAFSTEEFGEIAQERYDLDTARITGEDNPETYRGSGPMLESDLTPDRDDQGRWWE